MKSSAIVTQLLCGKYFFLFVLFLVCLWLKMFIAIKSKNNCSEALEAARRYSPNVEIVDKKTLVFDLTGSKTNEASQIAKELRQKFGSVAVSENLATALLLARWGGEEEFGVSGSGFRVEEESTQPSVLSTQHSALRPQLSALSHLPIEAISRKKEFLELMDSWAIHDLGAFARLPADEMVARFGLEILELRRLAEGTAFRAVNWNVKEDKFFWAKDMEGAIETIEPLNFVLSNGIVSIFENLDYAGLSTQSVKIILSGRGNEKIYRIRLVFPTKNQKLWIRQIVTKIELDSPGFNIERVSMEFRSTRPRTVQNNLYSGTILEPENLNLIVTKLKKVVQLDKIGVPKLRDSWSEPFCMSEDISVLIRDQQEFRVPGAEFRVGGDEFQVSSSGEKGKRKKEKGKNRTRESQFRSHPSSVIRHQFGASFYYLPHPVKARVFFESGEPKALLMKGKRELVRTAGGPWRMDAEWYKAKEWRRDEWDIETETGAVYRVFVDKNGEAFVDGGYD